MLAAALLLLRTAGGSRWSNHVVEWCVASLSVAGRARARGTHNAQANAKFVRHNMRCDQSTLQLADTPIGLLY